MKKPNIVFIITDNQSPWTLGCYGNEEIKTPNIDQLAHEGTRFTRCYSSNAVCSPTRATFLTGLIPSQHGVHCYLHAGGAQIGPEAYNTIEEFRSLPQILSESGYVCGLSGKWHLGDNLNPQEGFTYWVTKPHGHTSTFYDAEVIEDRQIRTEPGYVIDFWTEHGVRFIKRNKDRPFFLLLAYNGPYGLGKSFGESAQNRHAEYYADKELRSFPREEPHPWLRANRQYINNITAIRRYAAEASGVDDGVGQIVNALRELGLYENTLIIYTADQGFCGGHHGMWGMGDHSRPLHTYDETAHIPIIWRHPHTIMADGMSEIMISNYDFYPNILNYLGLEDQISDKPELPGRDYSCVLKGQKTDWDDVIYYEFENCRMIRTPDWKYTRRFPDGPDELYDLDNDPSERKNLANNQEYANIQNQLQKRLDEFFDHYANPKYDLWHGGNSKSRMLTFDKEPLLRPGKED